MLIRQPRLQQGANLFRALTQVDNPLVEPGGFQCPRCHLRERPHSVYRASLRAAKGAEAMLGSRVDIGVAGVDRRADARKHQDGGKVRLMECVHVRVSSQVAAHAHVAVYRIELQAGRRRESALNILVLDRIGEVVRAALGDGQEAHHLLAHRLRTQGTGLHQQL